MQTHSRHQQGHSPASSKPSNKQSRQLFTRSSPAARHSGLARSQAQTRSQARSAAIAPNLLAAAISLSLLAPSAPLEAATINISGSCGLADAITAANNNAITNFCAGGDAAGTDTLVLSANSMHTFIAINNSTRGNNGLPAITSSIRIEGNGATITRSGAIAFRHFYIAPAGYLSLENITLSNGFANAVGDGQKGGAIHNRGSLTLNNSQISGNVAATYGGGIYSYNASTALANSSVSGNNAVQGGGLYFAGNSGSTDISHSTVSGNSSTGQGAGIFANGVTTLSNSTVSGNTVTGAGNVGGGVSNSGTLNLLNSTIANNSATAGAGLANVFATVTLKNSLIANNTGGDCGNFGAGTFTASNKSLIRDGTCGTSALTGDPLLGPLRDNGGPTLTHALLVGSAAIGQALNSDCAAAPVSNKDQIGNNRPVGLNCDIGAFEFVPAAGSIDATGACSLFDAITAANSNTATGGCPAGGGDDTIILDANTTYPLSGSANADGNNRLPSVTSTITIQGNNATLQGSNVANFRLMHVAANGILTLDDLTLSGGSATQGGYGNRAGAIFNRGVLILNRSTLSGNGASNAGGALYTQNGSSNLNNSTVSGNSAVTNGGGLANTGSSISINNSLISNNTVTNANTKGGGWFNYQSSASLNNSTLSGNSAGSGGGIFNQSSQLSIDNSLISSNHATYAAFGDGGGIASGFSSSISLANSTLVANSATGHGGGFFNDNSTATISNSTVSGNSADRAGGLFNSNAVLSLTHSTVANNTAAMLAGGISNTLGAEMTLQNSLIADSVVGAAPGADCNNTAATITANDKNLIKDQGNCATTALSGDPLLGLLKDNGGPTQTHALLAGSPAIDMADLAICSSAPISQLDQRGVFRPQGAQCDIGAFEFEPAPVVITVDTATACNSLVNAIDAANSNSVVGGCPAGGGHDTIVLQNASVHELNLVNNNGGGLGDTGLPVITTAITIDGNGATVSRANAAPPFRLFIVSTNGFANGQLTLNNLTVSNGSAASSGGGILSLGKLTLNHSTVSGNTATSNGGGISHHDGRLSLNNSTVSNNSASKGGGIYVLNAVASIQHSSLKNNNASSRGAGLHMSASDITIDSSTLSANTATEKGGAVASIASSASPDTLTINNSTLSGNYAGNYAAAIQMQYTSLTLNNSTLANNQAPSDLALLDNRGSVVNINNSVLANPGDDCVSVNVPVGNNWFDDSSCSGTTHGDPLLGPLKDNGGPTQTHAIDAQSPLIDQADQALCAATPVSNLDQRGETRPAGKCDIGAYEYIEGSRFFVVPLSNGKSAVFVL